MNSALAANITLIKINSNLPGSGATDSLPGLIQNFYSFALIISGILAFAVIVYGGIRYATGKGNPSSESEGKSWITNALLGLLLLAGAFVILYTINPNLTVLSNPNLPGLYTPGTFTPPPGTCTGCGTPMPSCNVASCAAGLACIGGGGVFACQPANVTCTGCGRPNPACSVDDCAKPSEVCGDPNGTNQWSCQLTGI